MPPEAIFVGFVVAGAVIGAFYLYRMTAAESEVKATEAAMLAKTLADIEAGNKSKVNFVLTPIPFALTEQEKALASFPKMTLMEPKSVRVSTGRRRGSSFRSTHVSFSSGGRASSSKLTTFCARSTRAPSS